MTSQYSRERSLYLLAFLFLLVNRLQTRFPNLVLPNSVISDKESWFYIVGPAFSFGAIIYCIVATWRIFQYAGVSRWPSAINALISSFFFPLIYVPQMIYVLRRAKKIHNVSIQPKEFV